MTMCIWKIHPDSYLHSFHSALANSFLLPPFCVVCADYGFGTAIDGCHVANQPMPQGAFHAQADYSIRGKLIRISPAGVLKTTGLWVEGRRSSGRGGCRGGRGGRHVLY